MQWTYGPTLSPKQHIITGVNSHLLAGQYSSHYRWYDTTVLHMSHPSNTIWHSCWWPDAVCFLALLVEITFGKNITHYSTVTTAIKIVSWSSTWVGPAWCLICSTVLPYRLRMLRWWRPSSSDFGPVMLYQLGDIIAMELPSSHTPLAGFWVSLSEGLKGFSI